MTKKTTNKKKVSSETKKKVDVNDVDVIMEDMKKLALEKPVEEDIETVIDDTAENVETVEEEIKEQTDNKPKRKSYEDVFGKTWCGYGYDFN